MVKSYPKNKKVQLSPHFSTLDFDCHCNLPGCTITLIDASLPGNLERLYSLCPIRITRGYSCPAHNTQVEIAAGFVDKNDPTQSSVKNPMHPKGIAADVIALSGAPGQKIYMLAVQIPAFNCGGIGQYNWGLHVDERACRARWGQEAGC